MIGKLEILEDEKALLLAAADRFVAEARHATSRGGGFAVALAGGSSPRMMFDALAASPRREQVEWGAVRFYFGDERCVPPDHPDSNYKSARDHLFEPLRIPAEHVFRMRGEAPPQAAADEYEAILRKTLGEAPVFDLIFLGMGPCGHTASLFPGTLDQFDPKRFVATTWVEKLSAHRVTFTPRTINAARAIVMVAGGENKADALVHVLTGPREPDVYPSQVLNPEHGTLTWMIDRAAAKGLLQ